MVERERRHDRVRPWKIGAKEVSGDECDLPAQPAACERQHLAIDVEPDELGPGGFRQTPGCQRAGSDPEIHNHSDARLAADHARSLIEHLHIVWDESANPIVVLFDSNAEML